MNEPVSTPRVTMTVVRLEYEAIGHLRLPEYPGATLRGALGTAFRMLACTTGAPDCRGCTRLSQCAYGLTWETRSPSGADVPKRLLASPRPYVIEPPYFGRVLDRAPGQRFAVRLKLFGAARGFLPQLVLAAREAGRLGLGRGRAAAVLSAVHREEPDGSNVLLYERAVGFSAWPAPAPWIVDPARTEDASSASTSVRVQLETPLALKKQGRIADRLDPIALTSRLSARLDALHLVHEGRSSAWDFAALRARAAEARVRDERLEEIRFERYSNRGRRRVEMVGLVGEVVVERVHPDVLALWRCAEHVHAGKNATFGFGRVRVAALG